MGHRGLGEKQSAKSFFDLARQARQESNLQPPAYSGLNET